MRLMRGLVIALILASTVANPAVKVHAHLPHLELEEAGSIQERINVKHLSRADIIRSVVLGGFGALAVDAFLAKIWRIDRHGFLPAIFLGGLSGLIVHGVSAQMKLRKEPMSPGVIFKNAALGLLIGLCHMGLSMISGNPSVVSSLLGGTVGALLGAATYHAADADGTLSYSEFRAALNNKEYITASDLTRIGLSPQHAMELMQETNNGEPIEQLHVAAIFHQIAGDADTADLNALANRLFGRKDHARTFLASHDRSSIGARITGAQFIGWMGKHFPGVCDANECRVHQENLIKILEGIMPNQLPEILNAAGQQNRVTVSPLNRHLNHETFASLGIAPWQVMAIIQTIKG